MTFWLALSQNVERPAAASALFRTSCGGGKRARRTCGSSESTHALLVDMMSRIAAHNRLHDGLLENVTCAQGTDRANTMIGGGNLDCSVDSALFLTFTR